MAMMDRLRRRMQPVEDPAAAGMNMEDFQRMRRRGREDNEAYARGVEEGRQQGSYSQRIPMQPGMTEGDVELMVGRQTAAG